MSAKKNSKSQAQLQPSFEDAVAQLEQIIDQIESGEVGLEQSLAHYEQGMKLVTRCREILDRAQQRFAELSADDKGKLSVAGGHAEDEGYDLTAEADESDEAEDADELDQERPVDA